MSEGARIEGLNPGDLVERLATLEQRNAELETLVVELRAELERLKRRQQRQAAPFSKGTHIAQPKRPGRKPGQGVFTYRHAPAADADSDPPIVVPVVGTA